MRALGLVVVIIVLGSLSYTFSGWLPEHSDNTFEWGIAWINSPSANGVDSDKGYSLASATGASIEHRQYLWNEIEVTEGIFNWLILDHWFASLELRRMKASLSIGPINSETFGLPYDLRKLTLDDPLVISRYSAFLSMLLERYDLKYLAYGNEPNFYYREHPERDPAEFLRFTNEVNKMIDKGRVKILGIFGLTLIYEGNEIDDPFSIGFTKMMAGTYDVFGLSTYDGILNRPSLGEIRRMMDYYLQLSSSNEWAIVETGVATRNDEDLDYQVSYLEFLVEYGRENGEFLFLCWLNLFDYPAGFLQVDKFAYTGLFTLEGTAKPVVQVFGGGMYYDMGRQAGTPTNIFLATFCISLSTLAAVQLVVKRKRGRAMGVGRTASS